MLKKLYEKSEIWFAVAWIIAYVVLASTGDNISADLGIAKIVTLPILIAMSAILCFFVRKNGLTEKYGLCKPQISAAKMLFYIPLLVLLTANLWYGAAMNLSPLETGLYILSMFCVGFIEEMIFRGFLFKAVAKDGVIILTDSDGGGRQIRSYLNGILDPALVHNAYVPKIKGKEKRKTHPSKEGVLGVEGLDGQTLLNALAPYFADSEAKEQGEPILPKDLYLAGLSGGADSAAKRGTLAKKFDLPPDLSSKAFLTALNVVTDKEGFLSAVEELGL